MAEIPSKVVGGIMTPTPQGSQDDTGHLADTEGVKVLSSKADNLAVFKKDKEVQRFMKKYRYQYHVTMLPDLALLVRNAYLEGYHNGLGQYPVSDMVATDPEATDE